MARRLLSEAPRAAARGYDDGSLQHWARRIRAWRFGREAPDARYAARAPPPARARRDVYCYFDNDAKVEAPFDAQRLRAILDERPAPAGKSRG